VTSRAFRIEYADVEFDDDTPFSRRHRDAYFMPGRGPAESRCVFIEASRLTERFSRLTAGHQFVIGETGFGSGLNCLLAARAFAQHAPAAARLTLISAERYPLRRGDFETTLRAWPPLEPWSRPLLATYPPPVAGYHRVRLAPNIDLVLMLGDAEQLWRASRAWVDAWFLDGFAPSRNPDIWTENLFRALAARSRPGATVATFTAAGAVRRGLAQVGYEVRRETGFGGKRQRLTACWPGHWAPASVSRGHAVVAGAGLAGATTARALATRGWTVTVCDPAGIAEKASGNRTGVIYSTPSAHPTPQNRFYQLALLRATEWLRCLAFPRHSDDGRLGDVVQVPPHARARAKLDQAMASGLWPPEMLVRDDRGVRLKNAGYLRPARWCRHLLDHPAIECLGRAISDCPGPADGAVRLDDGQVLTADAVVLGMAAEAATLPRLDWLPLKAIRGQVSYCAATLESRRWTEAICHAGYLTPAVDGTHCVGATFEPKTSDTSLRDADDERNLSQLKDHLPDHWTALGGDSARIIGRRAALRCQSPDYLPLVGTLPDPTANPHTLRDGIVLNLAHGSRGITHTPLCADLVADQLCGLPSSLDPEIVDALTPERFILRWRRRQPDWRPGQD
jgi:tRNA 5-methylaminomethyl-2-thiouridine biosynthesis bifunctional protein